MNKLRVQGTFQDCDWVAGNISYQFCKGTIMNARLVTTCLLSGALLLPVAGYAADPGQTDPGFLPTQPVTGNNADRTQTDPGFSPEQSLAEYQAGRDQTDPGYLAVKQAVEHVADRTQTDPGYISSRPIAAINHSQALVAQAESSTVR